MAFTKADIAREVEVVVVSKLYWEKNEDGSPKLDEQRNRVLTQFKYTFAVQRKADQDIEDAEKLLGNGRKFNAVERLARLLLKEPEGFADFPKDDRPLAERVKEYFSDMEDWAEDALTARVNAIYPSQLFPGS